MKYDPNKHHRRSIRLKGYDYTQAGAYFVTICTQHRECFFGEIIDGAMQLNDAGQMVEKWWAELTHKFPSVETDEYIVMPNHFHGIIVIVGADLCVCPGSLSGSGASKHLWSQSGTAKSKEAVGARTFIGSGFKHS